jgi:uracil-DNA glycosylase
VPWYIGSGEKIRPAQTADLTAGLSHLKKLVQLLPTLRTVVIMGQKSTFAEKYIMASRPGVVIVRSPHPSPLYVNHRPGNRENIPTVFRAVAATLSPE